MLSNRKIDQIGDKLKVGSKLTEMEFTGLLQWRNSFSATLEYYEQRLKEKVGKGNYLAIAKRIKRIESIRMKLKRFSTMRLSTLQDVAGLRLILQDNKKLEYAYTQIRNSESLNNLKRLDDYHSRPKEDGYRGIHFVYQSRKDRRMVEIQLRTEREHIWATAVEVYGTLQKTSFKTGEGTQEWKEFFMCLSSYFALEESCSPLKQHEKLSQKKIISNLKKFIKKLKVIERLNAATNSIEVVVNKRGKGRLGKFALLELDFENNTTSIDIFNKNNLERAIEEYTQKELALEKYSRKNIVLVNIESVEKIHEAYPNYFLDTKKLLVILSRVVLS